MSANFERDLVLYLRTDFDVGISWLGNSCNIIIIITTIIMQHLTCHVLLIR